MLEKIIAEADERVIKRLGTTFVGKKTLQRKQRYFAKRLSKIWEKQKINLEDKFTASDIYEKPLVVIYLRKCCPTVTFRKVIAKEEEFYDYMEFLMGVCPPFAEDREIKDFYAFVKSQNLREE